MHVATGVLVVPAARVEGLAPEELHARDVGQLHQVEDADGHDDVAGADLVATVGVEDPAGALLVPHVVADAGVEQGVVDQVVLLGDGFEVLADFVAEGVLRVGT